MNVFQCYSCDHVCRKPLTEWRRSYAGFLFEADHVCPCCGDDSCIPRPPTTGEALGLAWADLKGATLATLFPWLLVGVLIVASCIEWGLTKWARLARNRGR